MKYSMSLVSVLAAVAVAQPHHHHNIRHVSNIEALKAVAARNEAARQSTATSWVTHWVTVTEYAEGDAATVPASSVVVAPTPSVEEPAATETDIYYEPTSEEATPTPTPSPEPETTVKESVVVPTPTPTPSVPAIAEAAKPKPSTTTTSTSTSTKAVPTPSPPTTEAAPTPSTTEAAPKPSAPSAPSTGTHGEVTFYDIGLGACGEDHANQDFSINVVALSADLIGPLSNNNPYCGKTITVKANGKTTTALVVDKCMGCASTAIDLSKAAFLELWGDLDVGRGDCEWYFNE